jgi:hypothetical protein
MTLHVLPSKNSPMNSVDYYSGTDSIDLESGSSPKTQALLAYENGTLGFGFSAGVF